MTMITRVLFGEGGFLKVRAFMAMFLVAVTGYMWLMGMAVSDQQQVIVAAVVFEYFGTRGAQGAAVKEPPTVASPTWTTPLPPSGSGPGGDVS